MVVITSLIFAFLQIFPKNMCLLFLHHYFIQKPKIFHQKSKNEVIEEYPTKES